MTTSPPPERAYAPYAPKGAPTETNGFAIAALVLGLVAIVLGVIPFFIGLVLSYVPTVLAIVFGAVGLARANRVLLGRGMALAGLVLGIVTHLLYFVGYGTFW